MRRRISIFGSTGSIGQNTVSLIEDQGGAETHEVVALTGARNIRLLAAQARKLRARIAVTSDPTRLAELRAALEGSGAHELPSWQGWLVGTSRAKVSGWSAEGATHGFFVGSQAPFTGVPIYPNASLTFTECVIAPGGDGPCFEAPTCSGVPFLELALRNCYFSWKGTHGFTDCVQGNGLRLEDNQYGTGSLATFFDTTPPWGTPLVIEQTASGATGLTINALPAINGVDNGAQFALRNASLTLANGQNDDVPNPGTASAEIVGPDADFEVSGVAGGTDGQIL